ncbi:MAG: HAMP domain-containing histidine kinase [Spirochaetales bacterium]|nr:HAMP domain-containing histidine kinase [Spirochaetales bacterium]
MKYQHKMVLYSALYIAFPISVFIIFYSLLFSQIDSTTLYIILIFQGILISVCIKVISKFDRRSGSLERAARRIAGGDLDYSLSSDTDDEFSGLIRSLEQMRVSLKEEQSKRFRFLMAVSHDLNTPLTSIIGYVEALIDGVADDPEIQKKYYNIIRDKSGLLESRIQELIDYVKTETGDWRLQAGRIEAASFFRYLGETYRHDAVILKRDFSYKIDLAENAYILADHTLVTRVFENLFSNAFRYSSEGDSICLDVQTRGKAIVVSIKDTGIGIEQDKLPFIFDPFFRASNSRREEGHGLGLSTVKNIVRSHDWTIEVFSTIGKGTEFIIKMSPCYFNTASAELAPV